MMLLVHYTPLIEIRIGSPPKKNGAEFFSMVVFAFLIDITVRFIRTVDGFLKYLLKELVVTLTEVFI